MSTILVLGANGNVGAPLVRSLLDAGHSVRAAGRSGQAPEGAEPVAFDYADLASFDAAFDGADAAYVLLPAGTVAVRELLLPVIEAAQRHKVKVVLQTAIGVDADESIPFRQVERALEASGLTFVILRPNWFADNFHSYWKAGIDHGIIAVPAAEGKTRRPGLQPDRSRSPVLCRGRRDPLEGRRPADRLSAGGGRRLHRDADRRGCVGRLCRPPRRNLLPGARRLDGAGHPRCGNLDRAPAAQPGLLCPGQCRTALRLTPRQDKGPRTGALSDA